VHHLRWYGIAILFTCLFVPVSAAQSNVAPQTADEWPKLLRKAQHGNHKAQILVALAFKNGEVVKQDFFEARKWFLKAAEGGDPVAEHNLGLMSYVGMGTERSPMEALKWFEKAATAGIVQAKFNAAIMYETGDGVPQNLGRALNLYTQAAEEGYALAQRPTKTPKT